MHKLYFIIGFFLLIAAGSLRLWVVSQEQHEQSLINKREQALHNQYQQIGKLVQGHTDLDETLKVDSPDNIQQQIINCRSNKEARELANTGFILLFFTASLLLLLGIVSVLSSPVRKILTIIKNTIRSIITRKKHSDDNTTEELLTKEDLNNISEDDKNSMKDIKFENKKGKKASTDIIAQLSVGTFGYLDQPDTANLMTDEDSLMLIGNNKLFEHSQNDLDHQDNDTVSETSDQTEQEQFTDFRISSISSPDKNLQSSQAKKYHPGSSSTLCTTAAAENSIKEQAETLQKQISEFEHRSHAAEKQSRNYNAPLNESLKELNSQVSAIRQYASQQQEKMKRLQDGYDWTIIRSFCLRVIRCIDNLEFKISILEQNEADTSDLSDVKDELIFSLESSGVEPYEPQINCPYRGQEKFAEAAKERIQCDDPNKKGEIAQVIRRGYKYFIDDENYKIVRTAQVKLYG